MNRFDAPLEIVRNPHVRRVFVLRMGAVGDLLVATAALSETLERFPNAEIWLAGPVAWTQILLPAQWPRITAIYVMPEKKSMSGDLWIAENESTWHAVRKDQPIVEVLKNCEAMVNLRPESLRYGGPAREARVAVRIGTCPWWGKYNFTHWSPWLGRDPILHERDRLLHIVRAPICHWWPPRLVAGNRGRLRAWQTDGFRTGQKADPYLVHQPGEHEHSVVRKWQQIALPPLKQPSMERAGELSGFPSKQYVFINPTASRWEKAWPKEKFAQLCERLKPECARLQLHLMLLGAPNETEWLTQVNRGAQLKVVQPQNFHDLMDVLGHAHALIANTSSLQFFANSLQVPAFVLMGRTFPARWGPLGSKDHFLCGKIPRPAPRNIFLEDYAAYDSLQVEDVHQNVVSWLEGLR